MTTTQENDPAISAVGRESAAVLRVPASSPVDRLLARLRSGSLDAELAQGLSPHGARLRAVRAAQLTAPAARAELAQGWADVLDHAAHPTASLVRVPLNIDAVRSAEDLIVGMITELRWPAPAPARAVALAHRLLTDGTGPLYSRRARPDLATAVGEVLRAFDAA